MDRRRIASSFGITAMLLAGATPRIQAAEHSPGNLRLAIFDTHSSVTITRIGIGTLAGRHTTEATDFTCVSFENQDPRPANRVTFHVAEYDRNRDLVLQSDLVRTGTFTQGATIEGMNAAAQTFDANQCVQNPPRHVRVRLVVLFVKAITYTDGDVWGTSGPAIPEHFGTEPPSVPVDDAS
jgi:hypothetical protein